jgi:hypothetical protein
MTGYGPAYTVGVVLREMADEKIITRTGDNHYYLSGGQKSVWLDRVTALMAEEASVVVHTRATTMGRSGRAVEI